MDHVRKTSFNGTEVKLYSGTLAGISSPVKNYAPVIIADIRMQPNTSVTLNIPASYSTFLYVLEGTLNIGDDKKPLDHDQVGWLNRNEEEAESELSLSATSGARFILYSGEPQGGNVVSHGPFIGDTAEDITRLYQDFRAGKMKHISTVPDSQKIIW